MVECGTGTDLSGRTVTVGVLHAVVVLRRGGSPALQLGVGLVTLGQGVDELVAAHVHGDAGPAHGVSV